MKKIFLISLIVAALFSSCQDDVINTIDGNTIRFDNAFVEQPQSRANDITTSNLESFAVHGWMTEFENNQLGQSANIFDTVEVRKNGGAWTYNGGARYWFANKRFEFLAFAPFNAKYTLAEDHQSLVYENNTNDDFIFASHTRNIDNVVNDPDDVKAVPLNFEHLLSRVFFQFDNDFEVPNVLLRIEDLQLSGLPKLGNLTLNDRIWTTKSSDNNLVINPMFPSNTVNRNVAHVEIIADKSADTEHFYIIPETIADNDYILTFKVTMYQGDDDSKVEVGTYNHTVALNAMTFEKGKNYRLTAKLNSKNVNPEAELEVIEFTVSVTPWGEDNQSEIF